MLKALKHKARLTYWWLAGYTRCLANSSANPGAWCKRRSGHLGKHSTSSGFKWKKGESNYEYSRR